MPTNPAELIGVPELPQNARESYWNTFITQVNPMGSGRGFDTDVAREERRAYIESLLSDNPSRDVIHGSHIPISMFWADPEVVTRERAEYYERLGRAMMQYGGQQAIIFPGNDFARLQRVTPSFHGSLPQSNFHIVQLTKPPVTAVGETGTVYLETIDTLQHGMNERLLGESGRLRAVSHAAFMLVDSVHLADLSPSGLEIKPTDKTQIKVAAGLAPVTPNRSAYEKLTREERYTVLLGNRACSELIDSLLAASSSKKPRTLRSPSSELDALLAEINDLVDETEPADQ